MSVRDWLDDFCILFSWLGGKLTEREEHERLWSMKLVILLLVGCLCTYLTDIA